MPHHPDATDAYEVPLFYNHDIPLFRRWTMTVLTDGIGHVLTAAVYNSDTCRGSFFQCSPTRWVLNMYDPGSDCFPCPTLIIRYACQKFSAIVGDFGTVTLSNPEEKLD